MSEDEVFVALVGLLLTLVLWIRWIHRMGSITDLAASRVVRLTVTLTPAGCALLLFVVLRTLAAHDVRDAPRYLFLYQVFGGAWVGVAARVFPRLGASAHDEVAERRNVAAAPVVVGALLGATLCFAGSNIGDGPGWWCVAWTALLATAAWFALWSALERTASVAESFVVERDVATGLRVGGFLTGSGLVLGRAAAGDWTGPLPAAADFVRLGWPAALLAAAAIGLERALRPGPGRPVQGTILAGWVPACVHVAAAVVWVLTSGPLS